MKFVADCMLGKLAKWLKILGFDAAFFSKIEDEDLLSYAKKERRILLTRDTGLIAKVKESQALFIQSDDWREQVHQVLDIFQLREKARPYSRCIECNRTLKDLPKERAKNLVTSFVFERGRDFALCPGCGRVFWKGTHLDDMEAKVEDILNKKN
jgi:uncharacterized protein with PIN domain